MFNQVQIDDCIVEQYEIWYGLNMHCIHIYSTDLHIL